MDVTMGNAQAAADREPERTAHELSLLTRAEMQEIQTRRTDIPLFHFGVSVAITLVTPFVFALSPGVVTAVVCMLLNLHVFHRFAQIVHGSDHGALFKNARWNIVIGRLSGCFLGYSREGHRATHNEHHMYLNTERDADLIWCDPESKVSALLPGWMRDLFLVSAFGRFFQYMSGAGEQPRSRDDKLGAKIKRALSRESILAITPAVLVQGLLFALYWVAA
jgi:fatty acid desaturase